MLALECDPARNRRNPFDTLPPAGMQGGGSSDLTLPVQSSLFLETVEEIYARVFRELKPRTPLPCFAVEYRPFANVNSSISMKKGMVDVKLSDLLQDAPAQVAESLARILLGKMLRQPAARSHLQRYRLYLNRTEIRTQMHLMRQTRGRKHISGPAGRCFNLAEMFNRLNKAFFGESLCQPELGWSLRLSRTMLGHFDPSHNAIIISRIFDEPGVPALAVEYVMFHEMLHLKFPVDHSGTRRCVHTREFRQAEKLFPRLAEAKETLKKLI